MEIIIGMIFDSSREYAKSGLGNVALNSSLPEELVETVLAHESVHLVLEDILIQQFPKITFGQMIQAQRVWDLFDLRVSYDHLEKKVIEC